jgi:hypothetical protein
VDVMDVVVLVVKNKRAHFRRIQNISFCANKDDGCERRERVFMKSHIFLIFCKKEERFLNNISSSSSRFDSLFIFSFNVAHFWASVSHRL